VRHDRPAGPAAARNTGLKLVGTPLVAFVDSDCVPEPGWLARLASHFSDPLVGIAAPRILPDDRLPLTGALASVERHRSPLDMGRKPGPVSPDARVRYVPTAALLARREVIGAGFDPSLRHGEDVDLVWRVCKAGWRIRYDPTVCVRHDEPRTWRKQLERRFRYGTSAAPLSARHPAEVTHLPVWPSPSLVALFVAARRPLPALLLTALQAANLAGRLGPEVPRSEAVRLSVTSALSSLVGVASAGALFALPALTAAARTRRALLLASLFLASPALLEWQRIRPPVAPPRWLAACIADDGAYGLGVLAGCARHRTIRPLMPRLRARATR
jgi:mycofactocin system glycosyltransferase